MSEYAERILIAAADRLDTDPQAVLGSGAWWQTFGRAARDITYRLTDADANAAIHVAWNAVPHYPDGATHQQWSQQLRTAAEGLR